MDWDEDAPKKQTTLSLGEDLSTLSVDELRQRIEALREEISRVEQEIKAKEAHGAAANAIFKS